MKSRRLACVALGFFPFVNFGRVGSVISFWPEWSAALLFLLFVAGVVWRTKGGLVVPLRPVGVMALALGGLLIAQVTLGMVHSVAAALVALWVLGLVFFLDAAVHQCSQDGTLIACVDHWSFGLLGAFAYHFVLCGLGLLGLDLVYFQIVPMDVPLRALGAFGQSNQLGVFSVLAFVVAGYLFLRQKLNRLALGLVYVAATLVVVMSFSRAAALSAAALGVALLLRARWSHDEHARAVRVLGMAVMGMAVLSVLLVGPAQQLMGHFIGADAPRGVMERAVSNQSRLEQMSDGLSMGWAHPWVGVGYRRYAGVRFFDLTGPLAEPNASYPHNLLIHFFAEFGLLGLTFVLVPVLWLIYRAVVCRVERDGGVMRYLGWAWLGVMFLYSMVEFPLMYLFFLLPTVMFLSLLSQGVVVSRGAIHVGRVPLLLVLFGLACALVWSAVDYRRIDSVYDSVRSADSLEDGVLKKAVVRDVAETASSSLFQYQAMTLWLAVGGVNSIFVDEKIDAAKFVMTSAPVPKTIARYVGLLLLARRDGEALTLIERLRPRNERLADDVLKELGSLSQSSPDLRAAMARTRIVFAESAQ